MEKKSLIINLYYIKKYKIVDIAKEINVSKQYISKIIKKDERYLEEKEKRKFITKQKQDQYRKEFMKNKRKSDDVTILKVMHNQASIELSQGKNIINNRAYRNWNSSAYRYNKKTKSYQLRNEINAGADVPKNISWK